MDVYPISQNLSKHASVGDAVGAALGDLEGASVVGDTVVGLPVGA